MDRRRGPITVTGMEPHACAYLSDGERLFRVVTSLAWPPEGSRAVLEDCITLEVRTYGPDEIWEMGLRVVKGETPSRPRGVRSLPQLGPVFRPDRSVAGGN